MRTLLCTAKSLSPPWLCKPRVLLNDAGPAPLRRPHPPLRHYAITPPCNGTPPSKRRKHQENLIPGRATAISQPCTPQFQLPARPFALGRPAALGRLGHGPPLRRHRPGRTRSCPRRGPAERSGARPTRRRDVSDALDPRPRGWRPDPSNRRPSSKRGGGQGAGGSPPTRDLCAWVHSPCGLPLPSVHARPRPPGPPAFVRGASSFFARDVSRPFFRALQFPVPQGSPSTLRC